MKGFKESANAKTGAEDRVCREPREFNLFLQTQLRWNQRKLVKSNGLSQFLS